MNDLSVRLKSEFEIFGDYTSLFSVVHNVNISKNDLNYNLQMICQWVS